jgi:hypothetical protein
MSRKVNRFRHVQQVKGNRMQLMTLNELLSHVDKLNWTYVLYLPTNETWTEKTVCAILESEEDEISNEAKNYISHHNLRYILDIQTIQSIVSNAKLQKHDASIQDFFQAFLYYHKNDAFITL